MLTKATFHPELFCRMLGKIGHSYAVAEFGYKGFTPFLPAAILGRAPWQFGYFVGGHADLEPASKFISEVGHGIVPAADGRAFIVVRIRLFADLGAPTFYVVAGDVSASSTALTESR